MARFTFITFCLAVLVVLLPAFTGCVSPFNTGEPSPKDAQQAYDQLISVKLFAFGGTGLAGITSPGELCYHTLASSTNRLQMFRAALKQGTTESHLYALCGIRQFAPAEFDAAAAPIVHANKTVIHMAGCIEMNEQASNIVGEIKSGFYDFYLASQKHERPTG